MTHRAFKTKPFAKLADKLGIDDAALCEAVREMSQGLIDAQLGGGVVKKRVAGHGKGKSGGYRTIVATNHAGRWVFMYVFAKADRGNIGARELLAFKRLAQVFAGLDAQALRAARETQELVEICHGKS